MIANMGPADYNFDETLSTLRYANRAKNIKNKPRINEDPKDAMLREFQDEIKRLKAELEEAEAMGGGGPSGLMEERVVEKVIEMEREINQEEMDRMKQEMEEELKAALHGEAMDEEEEEKIKAEAEEKAKAKLEQLMAEKQRAAEEAARLQSEAAAKGEERAAAQEKAREEAEKKEALHKKLMAIESKIRMGEKKSGGLQEVVKETAEELEKQRIELEERQAKARENQERLAKLEEEQLASEETYGSLQQEAEQKGKKLKKLWAKFQQVKREVDDINEELQREREDMLDSIRMLTHQMALKNLVIEAFVPPDEVQKVQSRAQWDDQKEQWVLERISDFTKREQATSKRPVSAANIRRPTTDFAKMAQSCGDQNPRFKGENILTLELDMPERTTYDYGGPMMDDRVRAALDAAFVDDGEMLFLGSAENIILGDEQSIMKHAAQRPSSARPRSAARKK
mmetsp:Transcript_30808/g.87134  ORF Transcript_30808/g.87134 Transcript_30808/m.87134 type:complete len:456 (-) Transcript_30808:81-1448(-)